MRRPPAPPARPSAGNRSSPACLPIWTTAIISRPPEKYIPSQGVIVGKLDGKVAVITGGTSGMALAGAKLFVDEGAHVFISGRRREALDDAVKQIGRNVTGVPGDAADLADLDRLFDTVKREKGA